MTSDWHLEILACALAMRFAIDQLRRMERGLFSLSLPHEQETR
jgi:hypothetical protein